MAKEVEQAQIEVKEFPICVRVRPGMYISDINQMVTEIIDNSTDEHVAGYCDNIAIAINNDTGEVAVQDDGRGIPVTPHKNYPDKSQVEIAFTTLHGGAKFGGKGGYAAKTGGMNGK